MFTFCSEIENRRLRLEQRKKPTLASVKPFKRSGFDLTMAASTNVEETELTAKECQNRIDQFVLVTQTDEAQAQELLQDHDWKVDLAVNAYFASTAPDDVVITTKPPSSLSVITWNIDGLDEKNAERRITYVIQEIRKIKPDVVLLQEVIDAFVEVFERQLVDYHVIEQGGGGAYFTCTLIRKTTVYLDDVKSKSFSNSKMGRAMQIVHAHIGQVKLSFINVHLESTKEFSKQRTEQLEQCVQEMVTARKEITVICGGDFNIRDSEVASLRGGQGLPPNIKDVWEELGKRKDVQYTWDCLRNTNLQMPGKFKPRMRFDRVLVKEAENIQTFKPKSFNLIGIEKVPGCQSFASDHWGILVCFQLN